METKNIKTETIIRTVLLVIALGNQILAALGKSPIPVDDKAVTDLISTAATVIMSLWSWWKNNSFTQAAIEADDYMRELKSEVR